MNERVTIVGRLGAVATIAYASTYYLPAIVAPDMARELGTTSSMVFLAFSLSLLLTAVLGPWTGRQADRRGGRAVLLAACLLFPAGLTALAASTDVTTMLLAWAVLGVAMTAGAVDIAYATVVHIHRTKARPLITGITLVAGFASTIGWLTTGWLNGQLGWRGTCIVWATAHLVIALPLVLTLPAHHAIGDATARVAEADAAPTSDADTGRATPWLLAYIFGATWFVGTAMAAHLPSLLHAAGTTVVTGILISSLLGPAQVLGRILEFTFLKRMNPLTSARIASMGHASGALVLIVFGAPASMAFALLHGIGNGVLTVANGTLPLHIYGARAFGARQGFLMIPARLAQAFAPYVFGLAIARYGGSALWLSMGLGVSTLVALMFLATRPNTSF